VGTILSTPTNVCMPLNSQRTSSHKTQLWRSGKIDSVSKVRKVYAVSMQLGSPCNRFDESQGVAPIE